MHDAEKITMTTNKNYLVFRSSSPTGFNIAFVLIMPGVCPHVETRQESSYTASATSHTLFLPDLVILPTINEL